MPRLSEARPGERRRHILACGVALRSPELGRRTRSFYLSMRDNLVP